MPYEKPESLEFRQEGFLLKTSIEGLTDGTSVRGERIHSFRNALGIDDI